MTTGLESYEVLRPAFEGCDRCIVFAANAGYMPLTSVAVKSIIDCANVQDFYDIVILHRDVNDEMQQIFCTMAEGKDHVSIRFFDMDGFTNSTTFYVDNRPTLSAEAYFRLYIPWVLSEEYRTVLYLDGDMLITRNINEVFRHDLGQYQIAGVRDYWGICNCYMPDDPRRSYRESIGLTDIDGYIISGTILFNLPVFRQKHSLQEVSSLIQAKKWMQHDQDVINLLCQGSILLISPEWGMMTDYGNNHYLPQYMQKELAEVSAIPIVIHYGGGRKPYTYANVPQNRLFWETAESTPFFRELFDKITVPHLRHSVIKRLDRRNENSLISVVDAKLFYRNVLVGPSVGDVYYRIVRIQNNCLYLEGWCGQYDLACQEIPEVRLRICGKTYKPIKQEHEDLWMRQEKLCYAHGQAFQFVIDLSEITAEFFSVELYVEYLREQYVCAEKWFEWSAPICDSPSSYYIANGWIVSVGEAGLLVEKYSVVRMLKREIRFCRELLATEGVAGKKAVLMRSLSRLVKRFMRKPVWLISDRLSRADDNGEALFRYLCENHKREVTPVFVISSGCDDYKRLRQYGKVVSSYSHLHKFLLLLSQCVVSSQTDRVFRNPFDDRYHMYRDMIANTPFVFLQHGVIKDDLSGWLQRGKQQLSGFVTSARPEYDSILNGEYHYTEKELWLTGLPRFDYLEDRSEKVITVMPTWRKYLSEGQDYGTGVWKLIPDFVDSEYASFFRNLLKHPLLCKRADELGYRIRFKGHPSFLGKEKEFGFDERVEIVSEELSYQDIYATSSLIITDYSSAVFDFVYLRKPIIYAQFDVQSFFAGEHIYNKGYFDYERDGLGEVAYDLESTVARIIEYMENGCQLKETYRRRIDNFFAFHDKNNCHRVFEKIMGLNK